MPALTPLAPNAAMRWSVVSSLLGQARPQRVLELGCGQGGFGARIAAEPYVKTYVGLEPDPGSYAVARERIAAVGGEVRNGSTDLLAADEQFDLLCAFEVIEHLENDAELLTEWAKHLAPGGRVLVSVPADPDRFGAWDTMVGHYRRYTPELLSTVLRSAGCATVEVKAYGWPLGYALEVVRNQVAQRRGTGTGAAEGSHGSMGRATTESTATTEVDSAEMEERTAASGRLFQPKNRLAGTAVQIGVAPFIALQRLRPLSGTGLVALGRLA